jgi:lipoate-protein ligase A
MVKWRYITGERESATRGLAGDEFLMDQYTSWAASDCPEPTLRLYTFRNHGAIIGRFQNLDAEVDVQECRRLGVAVNRRVTGGGAVLMGEDQLMIAVASSAEHPMIPSHPARILPKMARGVISGLAELGIEAEYRPKNDVVVGGKKIAGTALFVEESGALLYQASLIVDFDISLMLRTLKIHQEKISDKGIETFGERITTLNRELGRPMDMRQVREAVCRGFERAFRMSAVHSPFTRAELEQIENLDRGKYRSDAWIHQRQPALDMLGQAIRKTPAGLIHVYITLAGDMVKSVLITGDFFSGARAINDIEAALKWGRTDRESISRTIRVVMANAGAAIQGLDASKLGDIIAEAAANARHAQAGEGLMAVRGG